MKTLLVITLLVLGLAIDGVRSEDCENCSKKDNKECFNKECKCMPGYFYSKQSGQCSDACDKLSDTYTEYPKNMLEQGKALKEIYLGSADSDYDTCKEKCSEYKCGCVGFSVKRNGNSNRSRCFIYTSTPLEAFEQWRSGKGRWTYYQRDCE